VPTATERLLVESLSHKSFWDKFEEILAECSSHLQKVPAPTTVPVGISHKHCQRHKAWFTRQVIRYATLATSRLALRWIATNHERPGSAL